MTVVPVTVVLPVKNEEANLPDCLASLKAFAKVIVVDSFSTDKTIEVARAAGATVINFEWQGGFPKKRNWVLLNCKFNTEWVLFLDADERATSSFVKALARSICKTDKVGFWLRYDNHFMGRMLRHGVLQKKLALLRVGAGLYERIDDSGWSSLDMEVHEHPILSGPVGEIFEPIIHNDYRGLHHFRAKHNDYSSWEAHRFIALTQDSAAWCRLTWRQKLKYWNLQSWWFAPAYFLGTYILRAGILDGREGFFYAAFKFVYFLEVRAKIIELRYLVQRIGKIDDR